VSVHHGSVSLLVHRCFALVLVVGLLMLPGCGSGSSSSSDSTPSSSSLRSPYTAITGPNVQPIKVSSAFVFGYINDLLTSVTICVPGTTTCQIIPNILVDTGSSGLRLIGSQLSLALPAVTSENAPLGECFEFVDSYVWGPVVTADVELADEKAAAVPI